MCCVSGMARVAFRKFRKVDWTCKFPARNFGWRGKFSGRNLQVVKNIGLNI